jgi:hypothetical protein
VEGIGEAGVERERDESPRVEQREEEEEKRKKI